MRSARPSGRLRSSPWSRPWGRNEETSIEINRDEPFGLHFNAPALALAGLGCAEDCPLELAKGCFRGVDRSNAFQEGHGLMPRLLLAAMALPRLITLDSTNTLMRLRRPVGQLYLEALHRAGVEGPPAAVLSRRFSAAVAKGAKAFGAGQPGGCRGWWRQVVAETVADEALDLERLFEDLYDGVFAGEAGAGLQVTVLLKHVLSQHMPLGSL